MQDESWVPLSGNTCPIVLIVGKSEEKKTFIQKFRSGSVERRNLDASASPHDG